MLIDLSLAFNEHSILINRLANACSQVRHWIDSRHILMIGNVASQLIINGQ